MLKPIYDDENECINVMAGKAGKWRAHGLVGPWLDIRGGNALALNCPPI